jgi:hypothetical protein
MAKRNALGSPIKELGGRWRNVDIWHLVAAWPDMLVIAHTEPFDDRLNGATLRAKRGLVGRRDGKTGTKEKRKRPALDIGQVGFLVSGSILDSGVRPRQQAFFLREKVHQ